MNILLKAALWSIGLEVFLILLALAGHIGLSFLPYLALAFHFPALYLLDYWPAARATLIGPILTQWLMWFVAFAVFFALRYRFHSLHPKDENDAV